MFLEKKNLIIIFNYYFLYFFKDVKTSQYNANKLTIPIRIQIICELLGR